MIPYLENLLLSNRIANHDLIRQISALKTDICILEIKHEVVESIGTAKHNGIAKYWHRYSIKY